MTDIHNFVDAHRALRAFYHQRQPQPYTLETMRRLLAQLGNPQDQLRVLHIAGTSGKTSTAYYAAALLQSAGATVGLTVSPHVDEVNERLQINLQPLPEADFCQALSRFLPLVAASGLEPSYFEVMVALAYWYFAEQHVDYAVVEVGLGGLLDGTNVIEREDKVCIITDIGLDHTEILGDTLPQIARQKAGIITPHNQVFMYDQGGGVTDVVAETCRRQAATLLLVETGEPVAAAALPPFQQRNFGLARRAVEYVLERDSSHALSLSQLQRAARITIPARMERFTVGDKTVIVDGSHNSQKLGVLSDNIRASYPDVPVATLAAFVAGNDERWQGGLLPLLGLSERLILTSFRTEQDVPKQSVAPQRIAAFCRLQGYEHAAVVESPAEAWRQLRDGPEPLLLVAGSFYLLNHIRPLIVKA